MNTTDVQSGGWISTRIRSKGFTLIELMIVVAIVAIIAAIAYPSYRRSVIKSDRSDAMVTLQQAAQAMERCYAEHHDYTDNSCVFQAPNAGTMTSPARFYKVYATTLTPTSYTLTATWTSNSSQRDDKTCKSFTLDSTGLQGATDASGGDSSDECW